MSQHLLILTSPPASGKTFWISKYKEILENQTILVISPLRALRDECHERWSDSMTVMTPEEWIGKKTFAEVVIFDEFHLYFYWGDTFRPLMWEVFYELASHAGFSILLTATLSEQMKEQVVQYNTQFDSLTWVDLGNQVLKYEPISYIKAPSRNWVMRLVEQEETGDVVRLIFCRYRNEVVEVEKHLVNRGYNCLTCIGGESKFMKDKLSLNPNPDFIISTTVLSHGVNLPDIKKIYFLYEVGNLDFWIQMVARGGRRGQAYSVVALERPYTLSWTPWRNLMNVIWLTLRMEFSLKTLRLF